jgi:hypothetical protein
VWFLLVNRVSRHTVAAHSRHHRHRRCRLAVLPDAHSHAVSLAACTLSYVLLGYALAAARNATSWEGLDQQAAALPPGGAAPDDTSLFPQRGRCSQYPRMAHQYAWRITDNLTVARAHPGSGNFTDINTRSCLNGWTAGNLAARPIDAARFYHNLLAGRIVSRASLAMMTAYQTLTTGWEAYAVRYGMGLFEYVASNGEYLPGAPSSVIIGHGGADWGSGAPVNGFAPALGLGVSLAMTASAGMNCSLSLLRDNSAAASDTFCALWNATVAALNPAVGPGCPDHQAALTTGPLAASAARRRAARGGTQIGSSLREPPVGQPMCAW